MVTENYYLFKIIVIVKYLLGNAQLPTW